MVMEQSAEARWSVTDTAAVSLMTLVAAALRFARLTEPSHHTGDERFYVKDACWYLYSSAARCDIPAEANLEHPPLGKWIVAAGMKLFGDNPFGHRFFVALLGTLTIPVVYLLARRLLRSTVGAAVAAGLMAIDFMHFVLSRSAMLDVPLTFFVVSALLFMAFARDANEASDLRWRCAAGAAAGAAIASKWTGVMVLLALFVLAYAWDVIARRGPEERHPVVRALRERGPGWLLAFAVVPAVVYSATFIGRAHGELLALPWSDTSWLSALWERQITTFEFHAQHIWSHRYSSDPWSWPLTKRAFVMAKSENETIRLIVATGNPVLWTGSLLAVVYAAIRWIKLRRVRSAEGFIVTTAALTYLPWFLYFYAPWMFFTWGRVATFIFYFLPTLPVLYVAVGYAAARLAGDRRGRAAIAVVLAFAVASFAVYYPTLAYVPLSRPALEARLFAFDECEPPEGDPFVFVERTTLDGRTRFVERTAPRAVYLPPEGWCWL